MTDKKLTVSGLSLSRYVEKNGYTTARTPVFSDSVTTMDGVEHCAIVRYRGSVTVTLNPTTENDIRAICTALTASQPLTVVYYCQQRQADVSAQMKIPAMAANYLAGCLSGNRRWVQGEAITLEEM